MGALGWVSAAFVVQADFGGCGFLPEDRWGGGEVGGEGVEREGGGDVGERGHAAEALGEGVGVLARAGAGARVAVDDEQVAGVTPHHHVGKQMVGDAEAVGDVTVLKPAVDVEHHADEVGEADHGVDVAARQTADGFVG